VELSPKQYEAIGRMTLAFNDLEAVLEAYLMASLATPESGVSMLLSDEGSFHQKVERLKRILRKISAERQGLESHTQTVIHLLGKASNLAKRRNDYVHAMVVQDLRTKAIQLRMRGASAVCDEKEINDLTGQLKALWNKLIMAYGELITVLCELRESR
jgi:hypothetical protein